MINYRYDYTIYAEANEELFFKQCAALENKIPHIIKSEHLTDVDGTLIQRYALKGANIIVCNDEDTGALYVKSEIELAQFFN